MALRSFVWCTARAAVVSSVCPSSRLPFGRSTASLSSLQFSVLSHLSQTRWCNSSPSIPAENVSGDASLGTETGASLDIDAIDIRVGRVIKAWKHPEADSLYIEEVDLGDAEGPRIICSGLVKYVSEEELQDRCVMVLANLKPRNMRGIKSNGMLLAASDASHEIVELLTPADGSLPGERAWFGEEVDKAAQGTAATSNQLQKKKTWESIQPHLKTTEECVATYKGKPMRTSTGVVTCKSLKGASIT